MPTLSRADAKRARLQADTPSTSTNLTDLEWNFYSPQSGLTPASKYSITDHKKAYYSLQGFPNGSIRDVETAYFKSQGAVGNSWDEIALDFYVNRQFFLPSALANLELWLEADNISGAVLASDSFDRSKNLATAVSAGTFAANWGTSTSSVSVAAGAGYNGFAALQVTPTGFPTEALGISDNNAIQVTPGQAYTFTAYAKAVTAASSQVRVRISWFTSTPSFIQTDSGVSTTITTTGLTRLTVSATAPNNAKYARLDFSIVAPANNTDAFQFSAPQIELGSKATAFVWGDSTHLGTTDQGQVWALSGAGVAGILNGKAVYQTNNTDQWATIDCGSNDQDVTVEITTGTSAASYGGASLRYTDPNNRVHLQINFVEQSLSVQKVIAGTATGSSFAYAWQAGATYKIRGSVVGNTVTAYVNDVQVGSVDVSGVTVSTKCGIKLPYGGASNWQFDNFSVKTPIYSDGAAIPVWPDKSGYARHALQATAVKRPLLRSASPNLLAYNTATIEVDATGWSNSLNATFARSTAQAASGVASLSIQPTTGGSNAYVFTGPNLVTVTPGKQYTGILFSRAATTPRTCNIWIKWFKDASLTPASTANSTGTGVVNSTTGWTQHTVTATAPVDAAYAAIQLEVGAPAASETHYLDQAGFFAGTVATWLPPVTLPSGKPIVQFDGLDDVLQVLSLPLPSDRTIVSVWQTLNLVNGAVYEATNGVKVDRILASATTRRDYPSAGGLSTNNLINASDTAHMFSAVTSSTGGPTYIDGSGVGIGGTATPDLFFLTNMDLGQRDGGASFTAVNLVAIVAYSRVLSTTERQSVERYLKNKYGTP